MERPQTIEEYLEWAKSTLSLDLKDRTYINLYNANLNNAMNAISESSFVRGFYDKLIEWGDDYRRKTNSQLLMESPGITLLKKPYESTIDKSFRRNVLLNDQFPDEPSAGWVTPENVFGTFNDIIRSTLVCKFIDGPNFLVGKLKEYTEGLDLKSTNYSQEQDEGYYALHFYVPFKVGLLTKNLEDQETDVNLEIQLTTQLQDILKSLTYPFYQQSRIQPETDKSKWKWEYGTNRFRAGYLSHALHLLEAIIVELRDASVDKPK